MNFAEVFLANFRNTFTKLRKFDQRFSLIANILRHADDVMPGVTGD